MRLKIFPWLGQEFVSLSEEGTGSGSVEDETRELFARFAERLRGLGLTLDQTVRSRMWVRDMPTWEAGVHERVRVLKGAARSVSSSHIRPERLVGNARISVDMLAMHPPADGSAKVMKEYEPQTIVLRWLKWGGLLHLSGVTDMTTTTLDQQFPIIIKRLTDSLADGGASWKDVARMSCFLHRDESLRELRERFSSAVDARISSVDYTFVDSRQGKRLEVELTARLPSRST
jgi:enamine deaminase RidA (YjgF/YER057c/UK114 family)